VAKRDKRIEAMRRSPRQVTFDEMEPVLLGLGFRWRPGKGDHRVYLHKQLSYPIVVDARRPHLMRYQVTDALAAIDELIAQED
jgi:predicted RNA binding protein YcfA (HicA-like mRNA interferase family)